MNTLFNGISRVIDQENDDVQFLVDYHAHLSSCQLKAAVSNQKGLFVRIWDCGFQIHAWHHARKGSLPELLEACIQLTLMSPVPV